MNNIPEVNHLLQGRSLWRFAMAYISIKYLVEVKADNMSFVSRSIWQKLCIWIWNHNNGILAAYTSPKFSSHKHKIWFRGISSACHILLLNKLIVCFLNKSLLAPSLSFPKLSVIYSSIAVVLNLFSMMCSLWNICSAENPLTSTKVVQKMYYSALCNQCLI